MQSFVEILDKYFGNVCELDLIFNFHKVTSTTFRPILFWMKSSSPAISVSPTNHSYIKNCRFKRISSTKRKIRIAKANDCLSKCCFGVSFYPISKNQKKMV